MIFKTLFKHDYDEDDVIHSFYLLYYKNILFFFLPFN